MFASQAGPSTDCWQSHNVLVSAQISSRTRETRLRLQHARVDRKHGHCMQSRTGCTCAAQRSQPGLDSEVPARQQDGRAHAADEAPCSEQLTPDEIDRRLRKAAALMATAHRMAPFDKRTFNAALLIWRAVGDVPLSARTQLLQMLSPQDIQQVWVTAGQRYLAPRQDVAAAQGPTYSIWDDFPETPDQVVTYQGRAAVPLAPLVGGFRKSFFLQPRTLDLFGRVQVQKGPLGDLLYPLYYRANIGSAVVPATGEVSDVQLEYLSPEALGLQPADLPRDRASSWPRPRQHRWPFSGGLVDYLRAVGPGVYVGVGWKQGKEGTTELGRRFLAFMLVRQV